MTTKQKFDLPASEVPVVVLANGRYAYRVKCPWEGKNGKELYAFKFCSAAAYHTWNPEKPESSDSEEQPEKPESSDSEEQPERPESPA